LYNQDTKIEAPQFYGFAEIGTDYRKNRAKQNAIVKKNIGLFQKGASSAESVLRGCKILEMYILYL